MEEGGRGGGGGDGLTDKCYKRALIKPLRMVECNGVNLTSMRKKTVCHRVLSRAHDGKDCFKIYNPLAFPWKQRLFPPLLNYSLVFGRIVGTLWKYRW